MRRLLFVAFCFFSGLIYAQSGNSPYSRLGLGDFSDRSSLYNISTGTMGVAFANPLYSNFTNPALLSQYRLTAFDAALYADYKILEKQNATQRNQGGNLSYVSLVFPILKKASLGLVFQPYTKVNYVDFLEEQIPQTPNSVQYVYQGSGGISQVALAMGAEIVKGLSIGGQAFFNFGAIRNESRSLLDHTDEFTLLELFSRYNFGHFSYRWGLHYKLALSEKDRLSFGFQQDLSTDWKINTYKAVQRKTLNDVLVNADTLATNAALPLQMPASYAFGVALSRDYKYALMLDYQIQDWTNFKSINPNDIFGESFRIGAGAEYTPNINAIGNYLARINYRFGISYHKSPNIIKGTQLEDRRIHIGFALPMNRSLASLNLALQVGRRGVLDNGLIQETYFKVYLGMTVNDRWFEKRKVY